MHIYIASLIKFNANVIKPSSMDARHGKIWFLELIVRDIVTSAVKVMLA